MNEPAGKQLDHHPEMSAGEADAYRNDFVRHLCQTVPGIKESVIVDAAGCSLKTAEGRILLDMISGIAVSNLGHCHPAVVKAVQDQVARFSHIDVYGRFTLPPQVEIARRLASVTPGDLDVAFLTSTGTEATEGALKLARKYTGRPGFVAFQRSFHGRTFGSLSVTWREEWRKPFEPLLEPVRFAPFDDLDAADRAIDDAIAAVIVEPIQGEGGVRIPSDGFLPGLRELCTERGALLICDEVQGGMGRSGKWFSCQHWGVTPDVITVAKAFGGGLPLGGFISTAEILLHLPGPAPVPPDHVRWEPGLLRRRYSRLRRDPRRGPGGAGRGDGGVPPERPPFRPPHPSREVGRHPGHGTVVCFRRRSGPPGSAPGRGDGPPRCSGRVDAQLGRNGPGGPAAGGRAGGTSTGSSGSWKAP